MKHEKRYADGKYVPVRTCVACRAVVPKKDLIRVLKDSSGEILVDTAGNQNGRGAYICKNPACIEKAQKIRGLERGLKSAVPSAVYEECKKA